MATDFQPPGDTTTKINYNGNKYDINQWVTLFATDAATDPFISQTFANLLYTSGYFTNNAPFDVVGKTLWRRVGEWALAQTKKNKNFVLNDKTVVNGIKSAATSETRLGDFGGYLKSDEPDDTTREILTKKDIILELKKFAFENGFVISDTDLNNKANSIVGLAKDNKTAVTPTQTLENVKQDYRNKVVAPKYKQFADDIKAGADLKDLAYDYISLMSNELEIDPEKIDLAKDPLLSKALLGYAGKDGKTEYPNYSDFQKQVRQDARWWNTSKAKDTISSTALGIKRLFGL